MPGESDGPIQPQVDAAHEPEPAWYSGRERFFGNLLVHRAAGVIYGLVVLLPLVSWVFIGRPQTMPRSVALGWAMVVALGWPGWSWLETIAFEKWVRTVDVSRRATERAYFKLMTDAAKAFWTAVILVYATAAYLGFKPTFQ
jgi:hypothetical protein